MEKMRSYINLTKVFLNPIYVSLKVLPIKHVIEKKEVTEIKDIAEEFDNFFTNVGPNLAKKVPISSNSFTSFFKSNAV